jgi:amino acid transporter
VSGVEVLDPSVLAVFGTSSVSAWANIAIGTAVGVIMLIIAIVGIKITARTQVGMAFIEYTLLIGFGIAGLIMVLLHRPGTIPLSRGWLSFSGIGDRARRDLHALHGRLAGRRPGECPAGQPGFGACLHGAGHRRQRVGQGDGVRLGPIGRGRNRTGIVLSARIVYGMASRNVLSAFLGNVSARFGTPVWASIAVGGLIICLTWVYLLATNVQNAFTDVVDVTGLLFAIFYALTALVTIAYYRRRIFSSVGDAVTLGVLPLGAVAFLAWVLDKTLSVAPAAQVWSLIGVAGTGVVMMPAARIFLRPTFFKLPRESDSSRH